MYFLTKLVWDIQEKEALGILHKYHCSQSKYTPWPLHTYFPWPTSNPTQSKGYSVWLIMTVSSDKLYRILYMLMLNAYSGQHVHNVQQLHLQCSYSSQAHHFQNVNYCATIDRNISNEPGAGLFTCMTKVYQETAPAKWSEQDLNSWPPHFKSSILPCCT